MQPRSGGEVERGKGAKGQRGRDQRFRVRWCRAVAKVTGAEMQLCTRGVGAAVQQQCRGAGVEVQRCRGDTDEVMQRCRVMVVQRLWVVQRNKRWCRGAEVQVQT